MSRPDPVPACPSPHAGTARPYYDGGDVVLWHGDAVRGDHPVLPTLPAASVDAVVCDPPYELGFMGKAWDRSGVAFDPATWEQALRVLKPGGHLVAFGGTRTWHRMVCAIEDGGLEIRDSIAWLYGSGMPKARGVLKPSHEPVVLARRPGRGVLQVESCRIDAAGRPRRVHSDAYTGDSYGAGRPARGLADGVTDLGRWPTNVVLTHSPLLDDDGQPIGDACADGCVDGCAVAELDAQSGELASGYMRPEVNRATRQGATYGRFSARTATATYGDTGGASRFFPVFRWEAKAGPSERPRVDGVAHPTVKPLALIRWLCRLVTPPGGTVLDWCAGSGTTGQAARAEGLSGVLIEREAAYLPLIEQRLGQGVLDLGGVTA